MGEVEVSSGWVKVKENSSLLLSCVSEGGRPEPNITWWMDSTQLAGSYQRSEVRSGQGWHSVSPLQVLWQGGEQGEAGSGDQEPG